MRDWRHKVLPFEHQAEAVHLSLRAPAWAYLMEQGTGKSKTVIDRCAELFARDELRTLVVIAPNGLHRDWVVKHMAENWPDELPMSAAYFSAGGRVAEQRAVEALKNADPERFVFLAVNTEALPLKRAQDWIVWALRRGPSFLDYDESDDIKTPSAKRTRVAQRLARYANFRAINTGTEITKYPLDVYAQFQFLQPGCLGAQNFALFKARYAEYVQQQLAPRGGKERSFPKLVRFRNMEELRAKINAMSYRKLKDECLDLPPKMYQTVPVMLGAAQWEEYEEVRRKVLAEFPDGSIFMPNTLTKYLRLAQVTGGFLPLDEESALRATTHNAKLEALHRVMHGIAEGAQIIVWARFRAELALLAKELRQYGGVSQYHGAIKDHDRPAEEEAFHSGRNRIMLAQQQAGGRGKTWNEASFMIYYSNDFSYKWRSQSEDRAHRIGQNKTLTIIDLIAQQTIDEKTRAAHAACKEIADYFKRPQDLAA